MPGTNNWQGVSAEDSWPTHIDDVKRPNEVQRVVRAYFRRHCHLSVEEIARRMRVKPATAWGWLNGRSLPCERVQELMRHG